jgi:glycosyltransferase involved in cell wall biosynthesis
VPGSPALARKAAPRIALTTDWLVTFGGAERVLGELLRLYPGAPIHTTVHDPAGLPEECRGWNVQPSFLQRVPFARRHHRPFLPLMPMAFEAFDLDAYDVVLTTSSACAKGVITPPDVPNVCYCYTPPRYLWDQFHVQTRNVRGRALVGLATHWLRMWDRAAADRVDHFVAISDTVAARIRKYYRRESTVVYPPVDTDQFRPNGRDHEGFLLVVSRLVPYKRIDLAVAAANRAGLRLVVVGDGPELQRLRALAGPTVSFLGRRPDAEIADLYARCEALLFPGMEDFGITPVEAMAAGRPVIAYGKGGATETVLDGVTGVLIDEQSVDAIIAAVDRLRHERYDPFACRDRALRFDATIFRERIAAIVSDAASGRLGARSESSRVPPAVGSLALG